MLISIIGSPCSGKSTLAAGLYTSLKSCAITAEFITEQARVHILKKRLEQKLAPDAHVNLTDEDQVVIMKKQLDLEYLFKKACREDVPIVSDSCSLNALLYMSPTALTNSLVKTMVETSIKLHDFVFLVPPIENKLLYTDPNRVHSYEQSLEVYQKIPKILKEFAPDLKVYPVAGTNQERINHIMTVITKGR